jgi:Flp pilus assembly protein CpaB
MQTAEGRQSAQIVVLPLFQNILVLAIGQETGAPALAADSRYKQVEKKESSPLITLALSPQEANLIAFVQEQGKIRLILRSPADSKTEPTQITNWDALFQYLMPPQENIEKEETGETIEIYRGLSKEKMRITK